MDAILARLSRLEAEARDQKATNARLSFENEAHKAANVRLSSEVNKLRTTVSDQDRVIADLSKSSLPEGHWVWESIVGDQGAADEDESARLGRWVWSLEKYRTPPPSDATSDGPSASLGSLPVELVTTIFHHLPKSETKAFEAVCFRFLAVTWNAMGPGLMTADKLVTYITARLLPQGVRSPPISAVLDRSKIVVNGHIILTPQLFNSIANLNALTTPSLRSIPVRKLTLTEMELNGPQLSTWLTLLRFLNPATLVLKTRSTRLKAPSVIRVPHLAVESLLGYWTRLEVVYCHGPLSVPMNVGEDASFAFTEVLLRARPEKRATRFALLKSDIVRKVRDPLMPERDIERVLRDAQTRTTSLPVGTTFVFEAMAVSH